MRARQLGIATIVVLALLGATGCGDDGDADDTGTEAGDDGARGDGAEDVDGDRDDGASGDGESGDGASDGSSLATYADAVAIADALGCADTFEPLEAPPVGPGSPPTASIGFCVGLGEQPTIAVYAEEDMGEVLAGVDAVACRMLPGFAWIVGANWLVTPYGEPDPAVNDELAATLGGELLACS